MQFPHICKPPWALALLSGQCYCAYVKTKQAIATLLRWSALLLLLGGLALWALTGANRGWTRTELTTQAHDEITGLDYPITTKVFQPGVEFLGALLGAAAIAGLASWRLSLSSKKSTIQNS